MAVPHPHHVMAVPGLDPYGIHPYWRAVVGRLLGSSWGSRRQPFERRIVRKQVSKILTQRKQGGPRSTRRREAWRFARQSDRTPREAPKSLLLRVLCGPPCFLCVKTLLACRRSSAPASSSERLDRPAQSCVHPPGPDPGINPAVGAP